MDYAILLSESQDLWSGILQRIPSSKRIPRLVLWVTDSLPTQVFGLWLAGCLLIASVWKPGGKWGYTSLVIGWPWVMRKEKKLGTKKLREPGQLWDGSSASSYDQTWWTCGSHNFIVKGLNHIPYEILVLCSNMGQPDGLCSVPQSTDLWILRVLVLDQSQNCCKTPGNSFLFSGLKIIHVQNEGLRFFL